MKPLELPEELDASLNGTIINLDMIAQGRDTVTGEAMSQKQMMRLARRTHEFLSDAWEAAITESPAQESGSELNKLRQLCGCAYQMAGYHNAPTAWMDAFSDAANGTPLREWRMQGDIIATLLPYAPAQDSGGMRKALVQIMDAHMFNVAAMLPYQVHELAYNALHAAEHPANDEVPGFDAGIEVGATSHGPQPSDQEVSP